MPAGRFFSLAAWLSTRRTSVPIRVAVFSSPRRSPRAIRSAPRASLFSVPASPFPSEDVAPARETYLSRHANSRYWVDFSDFSFFRLAPLDIYYVGGFGVMGWVDAAEYRAARPDPLAAAAPGIMAHMNADHVDSMILLARTWAQLKATEAAMTSVDRLGFWLRLKTIEGMKGARINFLHEVSTAQETRQALVEMVRRAREQTSNSG
jgi:hypothetical protein